MTNKQFCERIIEEGGACGAAWDARFSSWRKKCSLKSCPIYQPALCRTDKAVKLAKAWLKKQKS